MTWIDAIIIIVFIAFFITGVFRGGICELVDLLVFTAGILLCLALYEIPTMIVLKICPENPVSAAWTGFFIIFLPLLLAGATFSVRLSHHCKDKYSKALLSVTGGIFAVFKFVLIFWIIVLISFSSLKDSWLKEDLYRSPFTAQVRRLNPAFAAVIRPLTTRQVSQNIAKAFERQELWKNKENRT
ncbi:MAG: CvpA family protein [Candidatus Eremiobacteraeota bacterium]|nr:CvpA family protein [Candidatus Eremiobacteraeota bacterium]